LTESAHAESRAAEATAIDQPLPAPRLSKRARRIRTAVLVASALILVVLSLRGRLPSVAKIGTALQHANLWWAALAAGLQAVSMVMFGEQQRTLLHGLGVRMGAARALAISLARSAISISFPAGAAVSAGYALRQYRRAGATTEVGTAAMVVSGLLSAAGLAGLYLLGVLGVLAGDPSALGPVALPAAIVVLAMAVPVTVLVRRRTRGAGDDNRPAATRPSRTRLGAAASVLWRSARSAAQAGAALRPARWASSLTYAALNWLTDLLCFAAATRALGLPIGVTTLAGIYLGVQIIRQIPVTPGGIGLIETAFIAGLTAAGSTAAAAAAAVLLYRLFACWLLIPVGGVAGLVIRREPALVSP
jgi:uncharacterized membrane protein YbhN (UPF0104 family)